MSKQTKGYEVEKKKRQRTYHWYNKEMSEKLITIVGIFFQPAKPRTPSKSTSSPTNPESLFPSLFQSVEERHVFDSHF
jgi:hypothetical protein